VRTISLHDTKSGAPRPLEPRDAGKVGIYACGPTVYSRIHVGNARPFVVFSLLKRFLEHEGLDVTLVANVTDINDKIYDAARRAGVGSDELAREMTAHYFADTERLGLGRPDHEPLATEYVEPIVALIAELVDRGHAYEAGGDVYFAVRSLPEYGELSHQDVAHMDQGEGVEGADRKRDPADFALWKAAKPSEDTSWPSPWGAGRPGWHIECTAIALEHLGNGIDVQGGGSDLTFPHHEMGASEGHVLTGEWPFAHHYVHAGMVALHGEKMSKSRGNLVFVSKLRQEGHDPMAIRLALLAHHYRSDWEWTDADLTSAEARLARWREAVALPAGPPAGPVLDGIRRHQADDLDAPGSLQVVDRWATDALTLGGSDEAAPALVASAVDAILGIRL
jgi:cysteinyl-tRNA synthetase